MGLFITWKIIFIPFYLLQIGILAMGVGIIISSITTKYKDLQTKINSGFFGKESTNESIISSGKSLHEQVLTYLEHKVLDAGDLDF